MAVLAEGAGVVVMVAGVEAEAEAVVEAEAAVAVGATAAIVVIAAAAETGAGNPSAGINIRFKERGAATAPRFSFPGWWSRRLLPWSFVTKTPASEAAGYNTDSHFVARVFRPGGLCAPSHSL